MSFGLAGSSGSGKTTLAKDVSVMMEIPYHDASVTALMKRIGFDPVAAGHSLDARLAAQNHLLDAFCAELRQLPRPFVTDRTPVDMAAYMLGEVTMTNASAAQGEAITAYVNRCLRATEELFDSFAVVGPLPFYAAASTRPPPNPAYQKKIDLLIRALVHDDDRNFVWAQLLTADREMRAQLTTEFFQGRIAKWLAIKEHCTVN